MITKPRRFVIYVRVVIIIEQVNFNVHMLLFLVLLMHLQSDMHVHVLVYHILLSMMYVFRILFQG